MKAIFSFVAATAFAFTALPSAAADGDPWMCSYKGYTEDGQYHYIAVKPFDGDASQRQMLNSSDFAKALFNDLAPGTRPSGEIACAMRPREFTEQWFGKILAGKGVFHSHHNTTLAEWRDGRLVKMPWPRSAK